MTCVNNNEPIFGAAAHATLPSVSSLSPSAEFAAPTSPVRSGAQFKCNGNSVGSLVSLQNVEKVFNKTGQYVGFTPVPLMFLAGPGCRLTLAPTTNHKNKSYTRPVCPAGSYDPQVRQYLPNLLDLA